MLHKVHPHFLKMSNDVEYSDKLNRAVAATFSHSQSVQNGRHYANRCELGNFSLTRLARQFMMRLDHVEFPRRELVVKSGFIAVVTSHPYQWRSSFASFDAKHRVVAWLDCLGNTVVSEVLRNAVFECIGCTRNVLVNLGCGVGKTACLIACVLKGRAWVEERNAVLTEDCASYLPRLQVVITPSKSIHSLLFDGFWFHGALTTHGETSIKGEVFLEGDDRGFSPSEDVEVIALSPERLLSAEYKTWSSVHGERISYVFIDEVHQVQSSSHRLSFANIGDAFKFPGIQARFLTGSWVKSLERITLARPPLSTFIENAGETVHDFKVCY
jgi:hypothetical protein